jgi:hypothetical protein
MLPLLLVEIANLIMVVTLGAFLLQHFRDHEDEMINAEEWMKKYFNDLRLQEEEAEDD